MSPVPPVGTIFFLFRRIRYEFKASTPGAWTRGTVADPGDPRHGRGSARLPLANTARVSFYVDYGTTAQAAVPGTLASIRGLEFGLDGQSEQTPQGQHRAHHDFAEHLDLLQQPARLSGGKRCRQRRGPSAGERLSLSILVIAVLSLSVLVAAARLSSERQITSDQEAVMDAFTVAQAGMEEYFRALTALPAGTFPPTSHDTTITTLPGGTAQVSLRRLRDSTSTTPAVWVVTSRGNNTSAKRFNFRVPSAERTVAQYAVWQPANLDLDAAFTSLGASTRTAPRARSMGTTAARRLAAIPGVAVPGGAYTGQTSPINGNPDNAPVSLGTPGTAGTAKDAVDIDWAGISAGTALPNYTIPGNSWPTGAQMNNWPVILANGDLTVDATLNNDGKGILIVTGNLTHQRELETRWHCPGGRRAGLQRQQHYSGRDHDGA